MRYSKNEIENNAKIFNLVKNIITLPLLLPPFICLEYRYRFNQTQYDGTDIDEFLTVSDYEYFEYEEPEVLTFNPLIHNIYGVYELLVRAKNAGFCHGNSIAENICVFDEGCVFRNFELSFFQKIPEFHPYTYQNLNTIIYMGAESKPDMSKVQFYDKAMFSVDMIINYTDFFLSEQGSKSLYANFHNSIADYNFCS